MRMIRWMCSIKVIVRFACSELRERERLGIGVTITLVQRHRFRLYGCVLRKDKNDWMKNAWIMKWKV